MKTFEMNKVYGIDINGEEQELAVVTSKREANEIRKYFLDAFSEVKIVKEPHLEDKPRRTIVIGETNNSLREVKQILNSTQFYHNLNNKNAVEQLVFLGNMFGNKKGFVDYIDYLIELQNKTELNKKKIPIAFIRGVNEYHLIRYIEEDLYELPLFMKSTIRNIEEELGCFYYQIPEKYPEYWNFLKKTIKYYENDKYIFIPSCIEQVMSWKKTPDDEFYSFNVDFIKERNLTGKTIIFNGVPAILLTQNRYNSVWINKMRNKICLNGSPDEINGKILGMYITENEYSHISARVH